MASYGHDQDTFFQEQESKKIDAIKADLTRRGHAIESERLLKSLYALKVPQADIINALEELRSKLDRC